MHDLNGANVLVTGGAGFIGSHLTERLVSVGCRVTVVDNLSRGSLEFLASVRDRIGFIQGDICDRSAVEKCTRDADYVFHLAAQSSVLRSSSNLDDSFASNVIGVYEVLRAAKRARVRKVVFTSSREVYGDPIKVPVSESAPLIPKNAYGTSKLAGELYCRTLEEECFPVSILRLANVYGPRDRERVIPLFLEQSIAGSDLTLYGGTQTLDFVWIDTVVDALIRSVTLGHNPGPINIGTGQGTTIADLAGRIVELVKSPSRIHVLPARKIESVRFVADVTKARSVLGIEPPSNSLEHLPNLLPCFAEKY